MQPILCVGESYEERRKGIELDFAVGQVRDVTRDLSDEEAAKLIVAYEPVWAIGTGMVATPQSAQDAANAIRDDLKTTSVKRCRTAYAFCTAAPSPQRTRQNSSPSPMWTDSSSAALPWTSMNCPKSPVLR